jgi:2-aminoadipate transaminase
MPPGTSWQVPKGGMFFWLRLPEGFDTLPLFTKAVEAGVAFVPGAPFYAESPDHRSMRLSFVTLTTAEIAEAVAALGRVVAEAATPASVP